MLEILYEWCFGKAKLGELGGTEKREERRNAGFCEIAARAGKATRWGCAHSRAHCAFVCSFSIIHASSAMGCFDGGRHACEGAWQRCALEPKQPRIHPAVPVRSVQCGADTPPTEK